MSDEPLLIGTVVIDTDKRTVDYVPAPAALSTEPTDNTSAEAFEPLVNHGIPVTRTVAASPLTDGGEPSETCCEFSEGVCAKHDPAGFERLVMDFRDACMWVADWRRSPCNSEDEAIRAMQFARDALLQHGARLTEQRDAAEGDKAYFKRAAEENAQTVTEHSIKISALRSEVERLQRDAERLDWLDAQREPVTNDEAVLLAFAWGVHGQTDNLREAIDAARTPSPYTDTQESEG